MSCIGQVFKQRGHQALIPYVTVGYPDIETTLRAVPLLVKNGADIIELGVPFSDPLADGVTIQRASFKALENGVTLETCLDVATKLRKKVDVPLVFMSYFNPIYRYGLEEFCGRCGEAGVDGLIIPDLPPEEGARLESCSAKHKVDIIYLLAPTSTQERIRLVAERSRGFIYLVSVTGVTGARTSLPADLKRFIARVRKITDKPLCVGFGISTAAQAKRIAEIADGVIVGSKLIQLIEEDATLKKAGQFVREMGLAINAAD